jgi:hypothetical protein
MSRSPNPHTNFLNVFIDIANNKGIKNLPSVGEEKGTHTLLDVLERANLINFQVEATEWVRNSPNLNSERDCFLNVVLSSF